MRITSTSLGAIGLASLAAAGLALAAAAGPQAPAARAPQANAPAEPPEKPATDAASPEEEPIRALLRSFIVAYNNADAKALADLFDEGGMVVDAEGKTTRGHDDLVAMYADGFEDAAGVTLEGEVDSIRFLTPDVARVEGQARLVGGETGDAVERLTFGVLAVRRGGKWSLAEVRDYPVPPADVTPYERLRELEWMVGDWVDESEDARVSARIDWAENRSFLVRSYSIEIAGEEPKSGTMFIGWDPQTGQIKSWVFDSEGGHGEGLWTRTAPNQWIVKAHGVVRDGRPNSATLVHTVVSKDVVKSASIDRILGGVVAPDIPEVIMVRQPPAPAADAAEAPADRPVK